MKSMGVNEIREKFLSFFESKGCLRLGSFPLIPKNDATYKFGYGTDETLVPKP